MKKWNTVGQMTDYLATQMDRKNIRTYDSKILLLTNSLKLEQVSEFELSGKIYGIDEIIDECFSNGLAKVSCLKH